MTQESRYPKVEIDEKELIPRTTVDGKVIGHYVKVDDLLFRSHLIQNGVVPDYRVNIPNLQKMKAFDDDILLCAYVKAGTHWVWEICSMLAKGQANYDTVTKESYMLEFFTPGELEKIPRPRVLNTHLPPGHLPEEMLQKRTKLIFIQRNPKDIATSAFHHENHLGPGGEKHSWDEYFHFFSTHQVTYKGLPDYVLEFEKFLEGRSDHVLQVFYEDIQKNPCKEIKRVAAFLGKDISETFAQEIADKCSFKKLQQADNSRENCLKSDLSFMYRKGKVGDWKNLFTVAQNERFDEWLKQTMGRSTTKYTYFLE